MAEAGRWRSMVLATYTSPTGTFDSRSYSYLTGPYNIYASDRTNNKQYTFRLALSTTFTLTRRYVFFGAPCTPPAGGISSSFNPLLLFLLDSFRFVPN